MNDEHTTGLLNEHDRVSEKSTVFEVDLKSNISDNVPQTMTYKYYGVELDQVQHDEAKDLKESHPGIGLIAGNLMQLMSSICLI